VPWQVRVNASADDSVAEVAFLIDGKKRWVEQSPPYFFDDDGQVLAPWLLGNGRHVLAARVTTIEDSVARVTAHVTVDADTAVNDQIAGTYRRLVTKDDIKRVQPYRVPSKGAFGETPPPGRWTIQIKPNGEILGIDPNEDAENPFVEPYSLRGSSMTLWGPAVWRQPNPNVPNLFCEPEEASDYSWRLSGSSLTITNTQKTCADRDIVFVGTWTRA
jgi:hypothetical protein